MQHDFIEFVRLLNKYQVNYLIVGGYAVNIYGYSRMTEDIDILFKADKETGEKLLKAIQDFDIDIDYLRTHDFTQPTHLRLGEIPNSIDLLNTTVGIDLNEVFENGNEIFIEGTKVRVIHVDDLIENKKALNTYKDLADAEQLTILRNRK